MILDSGYFDIKQSLSIKRRQDRSQALQLPDKTDPGALLALGQREFKSGNIDIAISFISKACNKIDKPPFVRYNQSSALIFFY